MAISLETGFKAPLAAVDWVTFVVELKDSSNGGYLKARYESLGVSYARPLDAGAGGAAKRFRFHLQHPATFGIIDRLLFDLDENYGLASPAKLEAMEVAIDFYHESACPTALSAMTERLMRGIAPSVITNPRTFGDRFDMTSGILPSKGVTVSSDKTLYVGNKGDDLMWRVYWKRTDEALEDGKGKRMAKPLPPAEWRARVEVRVQGKALRDLNLHHITDLEDFFFGRLYSIGLFKFAKRAPGSGPMFTNLWSQAGARSLGNDAEWPACVVNLFGRLDKRKRVRKMSRHLVTDKELAGASRQALRGLSRRFNRAA